MNKVDYIEGIRQGKCEMNTDTTYKDLEIFRVFFIVISKVIQVITIEDQSLTSVHDSL